MTILKQSIQVTHVIKTFLIVCYNNYVIGNHNAILTFVVFYNVPIFFKRFRDFLSQQFFQLIPVIGAANEFPIQLLV